MLEALKSSRFLFVIPDKPKKTSQKFYWDLADYGTNELGLEVYLIDVKWKKHHSLLECMLEATQKIHEIVEELRPTEIFFTGKGIGALLACQLGYMYQCDGMLLDRMPPLFEEELSKFSWMFKWKSRAKAYYYKNRPSYPKFQIKSPSYFLYKENQKKMVEKVKPIRDKIFQKKDYHFFQKKGVFKEKESIWETYQMVLKKITGA